MPYLIEEAKKLLKTNLKLAKKDGDYNYLFSVAYLNAFVAAPSYATIALIWKASRNPNKLESVRGIENFLTVNGVPALDREGGRELAWLEFYRRIGAKYEDRCIEKNGDLDEFKEAEKIIQEKFSTVGVTVSGFKAETNI